ncbi:hypothetical protein [Haloterrigena salina]|nr:hypothetical protein [Haloterrigena salina]
MYRFVDLTLGDPAYQILREQRQSPPSEREVNAFRAEHGFDEPFVVQYLLSDGSSESTDQTTDSRR